MKQDEQYIEQYDMKGGDGPTRRGSVQVGGMVIENPLQVRRSCTAA